MTGILLYILHTHENTHRHTHKTHTDTHTKTHTDTHMQTHTVTHRPKHKCIHIRTNMQKYTHKHTHKYTHTHTHTHNHPHSTSPRHRQRCKLEIGQCVLTSVFTFPLSANLVAKLNITSVKFLFAQQLSHELISERKSPSL